MKKLKGAIADVLEKEGHFSIDKGDITLLFYYYDDPKKPHYRAQIYNKITDEMLWEKEMKKSKDLGDAVMEHCCGNYYK
jgi:uncharacterized phage-like protein YoqJ